MKTIEQLIVDYGATKMPKVIPLPVKKRWERRRWLLIEDWECTLLGKDYTYIIPAGFVFDGASIPRLFWNILSPTGYLFMAGLVHDFVYKHGFLFTYSTLELDGVRGRIYREQCTQKEADYKFESLAHKICLDARYSTKAALISLRAFGWLTWNNYRKQNLDCDLVVAEFEKW